MLRHRLVHAGPERGGRGGRDGDAALLLLLHPVHGGGTVVHFTDLVADAGVEQDALGRGGLAGIDVGHDAEVAVTVDGSGASHGDSRNLRSEEHTSELQSLMRISYAVFCLKKKKYTCKK